ncbi:GTP pyrophosphokinase family protein [Rhodococcus sp. SMB37]|uniref:GTP pyrophosphokinase family protein n=1 Tax=Rhodococcus sp. SMB37 TaxID=2512213 RepID=UPI001052E194|nr:GTP pyrophosphokinase family protein [Rhodococcus sp. SMB37]
MLWHHELAATIADEVASRRWESSAGIELEVSSRGKTIDTLIQKLRRPPLIPLDQVQDLAGVRVDADMTLSQQTAFAHELAAHYEVEERCHRDLRADPHSGYRAYHLWLRVPAGRAEIQIRTEGQSAWANTYERMGDTFGRGIRYDEAPSNRNVQKLVEIMHSMSEMLMRIETQRDELSYGQQEAEARAVLDESPHPELHVGLAITLESIERRRRDYDQLHADHLAQMDKIRRMIEDLEEVS